MTTSSTRREFIARLAGFVVSERTQLIHTALGTVAGAFLGAFLALTQSDCADRAAAIKKLEMVRREAEMNFDVAIRLREGTGVTVERRTAVLERLDVSMVQAAMQDERVAAALPAEILSLLVTYVRDGQLAMELQNRYNTLAIEWAAVSPGNVAPGLGEAAESVRYNASVFAAESLLVGEELAKLIDVSKFDAAPFIARRAVLEKRLKDVTQGIVDGRYESIPRAPRITPSK